jgi:predicted nucleic acid-binding protein
MSARIDAGLFRPGLFCSIHARRYPERRNSFREALDTFHSLAIALRDVNVEGVFDLAEQTRLTAYDASYLWLALVLNAELVTLDAELGRAYA